jgi:Na+-transporting NADH:ubiquinone oxidoreductase subunit F
MAKVKPIPLKLKVVDKNWISKKVIKLVFEVLEPIDFEFLPGQHISIKVAEQIARPYTIASNPMDNEITLAVSASHAGVGADYLKGLRVGDSVEGMGPLGNFTLDEDMLDNVVMVASGTGIAPLLSMLYVLSDKKVDNNIKLYFGVRDEDELFFEEEIKQIQANLPNFSYEICLSAPAESWIGNKGYVNDFVEITDPENTQVYLCGVKEMVSMLKEKLANEGVPEENIFS